MEQAHKFVRYAAIGCINTILHWTVFALIYHFLAVQAVSNVMGFVAAASFSYIANARLTFRQQASGKRYALFMGGMLALSLLTGAASDILAAPPLATLVVFSLTSLTLGFLFSSLFVFREDARGKSDCPRL